MPSQTIHRIYTEEKNSRAILDLLNERFESFTLQPTPVITVAGLKDRS